MVKANTKSVTVAILAYNRSDAFVRCIKSIATDDTVQEVAVFDDCSAKDHFSVIEKACGQYKRVALNRNPVNLGYSQNLLQALYYLKKAKTPYAFLCESDMLLARDWGYYIDKAFELSSESVALSPNLTHYQLSRCFSQNLRHDHFKSYSQNFLSKKANLKDDDSWEYIVNSEPLDIPYLRYGQFKLRYVSCSVGTLVFKTDFLRKIGVHLVELGNYSGREDSWLSWACQYFNYNLQTSLISLDPGLALALGEPGLNGSAITTNLRWHGNILWRYSFISSAVRILYVISEKIKARFLFHFRKYPFI